MSGTQGVISALEEQLAEVQRRNAQLDSELRAAQLTKLDMAASIAPVSTTVTSTLYSELFNLMVILYQHTIFRLRSRWLLARQLAFFLFVMVVLIDI